jgi:hypothetical protein
MEGPETGFMANDVGGKVLDFFIRQSLTAVAHGVDSIR